MGETITTAEGRCLCGTIRYRIEGVFEGIIHCHCQRCRKHFGSTFASFAAFKDSTTTWTSGEEQLGAYVSSVPPGRHFCPVCGSTLPRPGRKTGTVAGNLLDLPAAGLSYHFYLGSKAPWYEPTGSGEHLYETVHPDFSDPDLPPLDRPRAEDDGAIAGSCLCGAVRFEARAPLMMMNCHCSRYRLSRSAAHATNLFVAGDAFRWLDGEDRVRTYRLPEAARFGAAFCGDCGSLVPRAGGERVNVPCGCLDCDPGVRPAGHIYVGSKALWYEIEDGLQQWESRPSR